MPFRLIVNRLLSGAKERLPPQLLISYPCQNDRVVSIIGDALDRLRVQRRPSLALDDLSFALRLDQQVTRTGRDVVEPIHVNQARSHIKKKRLIVGIERVERLRI